MAIRELARELYRLQQDKDRLEAALAAAPFPEQAALADRLRQVRAQWQRLKDILEGEKAPPPFRQIPSTIRPRD
ncbi:MAG: hypothetical protein AB1634_15610 [Thermodesulfobacteriota bacterium]